MSDIKTILSEKHLDTANDKWQCALDKITEDDVLRQLALPPGRYSLDRLITLISPAAEAHLEQMAQAAHQLTIQRFGKTIQMYAPLYVSNYCVNKCAYCGYNTDSKFKRTRLTLDDAVAEADIIAAQGFRHILIVSGRDTDFVTVDYLTELTKRLSQKFSSISVEIYPMSQSQYRSLVAAGIDGVALYQETYDRKTYAAMHQGQTPKSDYDNRLLAHDRSASAGMRRMGIGALLGLADWRTETLALAEHASYLMKKYWQGQVAFSFPRLRPALNVQTDLSHPVTDKNLVQMAIALRLCFADAGIVLSTRESPALRNSLIKICITRISAGSKTNPGGYSGKIDSAKQFEIDDDRPPAEVARTITAAGAQPVWKDWDAAFGVLPNKKF